MQITRVIKEGDELPRWYGASYRIPGTLHYACLPIPLNVVVSFWLSVKDWILCRCAWTGTDERIRKEMKQKMIRELALKQFRLDDMLALARDPKDVNRIKDDICINAKILADKILFNKTNR